MEISDSTEIVYLDQKGWIDLAKIYYGRPSNSEKALLEKILQHSDKGTAVFPLSIAKGAKLDEKCNTVILSFLSELFRFL